MADVDLGPAVKLSARAAALFLGGSYLKSVEKSAAAAQALQEMDPQEDNLVVAMIRSQQTLALNTFASFGNAAEAEQSRERALRLLPGAIATMRRRKAAGTLLPDRCRLIEMRWAAAMFLSSWEGDDPPRDAPEVRCIASFVGLTAYFTVAAAAADCFQPVLHAPAPFCEEWAAAELQVHTFVAEALDFMRESAVLPAGACMPEEGELVRLVELAVANGDVWKRHPAGLQLRRAWQRLQDSGVLQRRGLLVRAAQFEGDARLRLQARRACLRSCALADCAALELNKNDFKLCAACRGVAYCCAQHQTLDWPRHKAPCKAARKAAAAAAALAQAPCGAAHCGSA